ncbi:fatty acid desaturase [Chamaesiphon sp. VAR_69_metabat_338]|uniref:fatty acid desaturase n=1 Tax=Chamaesiphon sp. VAR_69_metabat_338 TaxID=2964704 RepID=UPI00286D824C|nr:fatty acid desaturase [Chamaesiphon sp. VAR_69_metabat_338]
MQHDLKSPPLTGLLVATTIVAFWLGSLAWVCSLDVSTLLPLGIFPVILGRTFIQTGLFIVAHDAIHGSVLPGHRRVNKCFGHLALALYALLPYQKLAHHHWQHHLQPGRLGDPDFHDGVRDGLGAWYVKFMQEYLDFRQKVVLFFGMKVIFFSLFLGFHVPIPNLFLFWVLPIVLSSMQLFFFGTYLPHRSAGRETPTSQHQNSHNAISTNYPIIWSFLTCYHFGYHWEHHEYPSLPWYQLPTVRQHQRKSAPVDSSGSLTSVAEAQLQRTITRSMPLY